MTDNAHIRRRSRRTGEPVDAPETASRDDDARAELGAAKRPGRPDPPSGAGQPADAEPAPQETGAVEDTGPHAEQAPQEAADDEDTGPHAEQAPQEAADDEHLDRSAEELVEALAAAERSAAEYLDHLQRERAEFDNFRRRSTKERMEALDRGAEQVLRELLPVLDNFGFVLDAAKGSSDEQLAKGTQMVHDELLKVLHGAGLEHVPGEGEPFDPQWHEAIQQAEAPETVDHPVVAEVLRPGYRFKGRLLRPASVSVAQ